MLLNLTYEFLVSFFRDVAINVNRCLVFFKFYTKFDKLSLKTGWEKASISSSLLPDPIDFCVYCTGCYL